MRIIPPPTPISGRTIRWTLRQPGQINRSEWTGTRQAVILPGAARWSASGEFVPRIRQVNAAPWRAFFAQLQGVFHSFPLRAVEAAQTAANNPTVNGASQTGYSLALTLPAGTIGATYLPKGSMITIPFADGTVQMTVLSADLTYATGTTGTAAIVPPLRKSPANAAAIEAQWPYALMIMTNDISGWDVAAGQIYSFAFDAEEAF